MIKKPLNKPLNPQFSPGPAKKRDGYYLENLDASILGRSHRSKESGLVFQDLIKKIKLLFEIPDNYKIILAPASDTGAIELAIWNLLGKIPVDSIGWDSFGYMWQEDLKDQIKLEELNLFTSEFGKYPDTRNVDFKNHDVLFTLCGTTSGVVFNEFDRIPIERNGLIITDGTSMIGSKRLDWNKLDVLTFSWQKCLGGEAQNGILIMSPRAIQRLRDYTPNRAIPHIYRIKEKDGSVKEDILHGSPINTPSMLSVIDFIDALDWAIESGGLDFCIERGKKNFLTIKNWISKSTWVDFLCENIDNQSHFALCLKIVDKSYLNLSDIEKTAFVNKIFEYLNKNKIAYDIESYKKAPTGLRIWGGVTVNYQDIEALTHWLDYCFYSLKNTNTIE